MRGDFGAYINKKRKGRSPDGSDILLRDLAKAMGNMSVSYLSDIIKERRHKRDLQGAFMEISGFHIKCIFLPGKIRFWDYFNMRFFTKFMFIVLCYGTVERSYK